MARHAAGTPPPVAHEAWLEAGLAFDATQGCPYCGQELRDRSLLDLYRDYFSDAYKALATDVKQRRQTLDRYGRGEFRQALATRTDANRAAIQHLKTMTGEDCAASLDIAAVAGQAALKTSKDELRDQLTAHARDAFRRLTWAGTVRILKASRTKKRPEVLPDL